jgi:uncharacterized membrane protein
MTRVLLVGETWVTVASHYKGWDYFRSVTFHSGADRLERALRVNGPEMVHMPAHEAAERFPMTIEELDRYDVVILSDVGANTLLLHPDTWLQGRSTPNRLTLVADWVEQAGGGLAMAGGYMSFQGIDGRARYRGTPVERVLPSDIDPWDDRVELPEGFSAKLVTRDHPVVEGIEGDWPALLGYNRFRLKDDALLLAKRDDDPILAVRQAGKGRTLAWASDIGPHWCPDQFSDWDGYRRLWRQAIEWLAGEAAEADDATEERVSAT